MKPEQQIKALAELDGWTCENGSTCKHCGFYLLQHIDQRFCNDKDYLASHDAIIPLIQKQRKLDQFFIVNFWKALHKIWHNGTDLQPSEGDYELYYFGSTTVHWAAFDSTPSQLCEALLRATNKWIEE